MQQELKSTIASNSQYDDQEEYQVEVQQTEDNENAQYEVVEYQDEEYIVEMKEPDEIYDENMTIKQEVNEYEEEQVSHYENPNAIVKVEPIEYDYSDLKYQIPSNDLQDEIESQLRHVIPKISNSQTISPSQNLKRKFTGPEILSSSSIPQNSLKFALESSKLATKRMKAPQGVLKCQYCTERFDNCNLILEHIEEKHKFQCPICSQSFPFKINLIHHEFMHHKAKKTASPVIYKHSCGNCMMKFSTGENLEIHMRQEHNAVLKGLRVYVDEEKVSFLET
jgi:hypothetical protein